MNKTALFSHEMMLNCSLPLKQCVDMAVERAAKGTRSYIVAADENEYDRVIQHICDGRSIPQDELRLIHVMVVNGV